MKSKRQSFISGHTFVFSLTLLISFECSDVSTSITSNLAKSLLDKAVDTDLLMLLRGQLPFSVLPKT